MSCLLAISIRLGASAAGVAALIGVGELHLRAALLSSLGWYLLLLIAEVWVLTRYLKTLQPVPTNHGGPSAQQSSEAATC